jgi:Protein of unknown function (DUF2510)
VGPTWRIADSRRKYFYAAFMKPHTHSVAATVTCTKSTTAGAIVGVVILVAIVGAIVFFAVANARARRSLAAANAELNYLRPENARLQQWIAGFAGTPMSPEPPSGYDAAPSMPPQWYPDPSGRHELRHWNGTTWTDEVSDGGVTSRDATN